MRNSCNILGLLVAVLVYRVILIQNNLESNKGKHAFKISGRPQTLVCLKLGEPGFPKSLPRKHTHTPEQSCPYRSTTKQHLSPWFSFSSTHEKCQTENTQPKTGASKLVTFPASPSARVGFLLAPGQGRRARVGGAARG